MKQRDLWKFTAAGKYAVVFDGGETHTLDVWNLRSLEDFIDNPDAGN